MFYLLSNLCTDTRRARALTVKFFNGQRIEFRQHTDMHTLKHGTLSDTTACILTECWDFIIFLCFLVVFYCFY